MKIHDIENATKTEAATFFRCSTRTIDRWIHGGQLSAFRGPGRRVLIPALELAGNLRPTKPTDVGVVGRPGKKILVSESKVRRVLEPVHEDGNR